MFIDALRSPATVFALVMAAALLLAAGIGDAGTVADTFGGGRAR